MELEPGFVDLIKANIERAKATGKARREMGIIQGDARNLPGLLSLARPLESAPIDDNSDKGAGTSKSRLESNSKSGTSTQNSVSQTPLVPGSNGDIGESQGEDSNRKRYNGQQKLLTPGLLRKSQGPSVSRNSETTLAVPRSKVIVSADKNILAEAVVFSPPFGPANRGGGIAKGKMITIHGFELEHGSKRLEGKLSANPENLSNLEYGNRKGPTYLSEMLRVYRGAFETLKPGGVMVVMVRDFIRNKKLVLLHEDTIRLCRAVGFGLEAVYLFKLPVISFWRVLYYRKHPGAPRIEHEHVLIFRKAA